VSDDCGNVNYNFYGVGFDAGSAGLKLPQEQSGQVSFGVALRRMKWDFFMVHAFGLEIPL